MEGEFLSELVKKTYEAKSGDFVYGPRMVPHTFSKVGTGLGRVLIGFQPAGRTEEYFTKLSQGVAKDMTNEQREASERIIDLRVQGQL